MFSIYYIYVTLKNKYEKILLLALRPVEYTLSPSISVGVSREIIEVFFFKIVAKDFFYHDCIPDHMVKVRHFEMGLKMFVHFYNPTWSLFNKYTVICPKVVQIFEPYCCGSICAYICCLFVSIGAMSQSSIHHRRSHTDRYLPGVSE